MPDGGIVSVSLRQPLAQRWDMTAQREQIAAMARRRPVQDRAAQQRETYGNGMRSTAHG
jgi:hypothetical protein